MRSILLAMKSFSCNPLILVLRETVVQRGGRRRKGGIRAAARAFGLTQIGPCFFMPARPDPYDLMRYAGCEQVSPDAKRHRTPEAKVRLQIVRGFVQHRAQRPRIDQPVIGKLNERKRIGPSSQLWHGNSTPISCRREPGFQVTEGCRRGDRLGASQFLAKAGPGLRLNEYIEADGPTVFAHACKMGLEGIVSKHKTSKYRSGRSPDWLKCKNPACEAVKRDAEEDWGR
jgi:hypothetical protein